MKVTDITYDTLIKTEKMTDFLNLKFCRPLLIAFLKDRANEWTQSSSDVKVNGKEHAKFRIYNRTATLVQLFSSTNMRRRVKL